MSRALVIALAALASCSGGSTTCELTSDCPDGQLCVLDRCRRLTASAGEPCSYLEPMVLCKRDLRCEDEVCVAMPRAGEACSEERRCASKLTCFEGRCTTYDEKWEREARAREAAEQAERETEAARREAERLAAERRMLEEAGARMPVAEGKPSALPRGPGRPVRVVAIENPGHAVAGCKETERLIGGNCDGANIVANRPEGFGEQDTVGARWTCRAAGDTTAVTAFALCEPLPDSAKP